jgi:hypothetical protein
LDSSQIELKGSEIRSLGWDCGVLRIGFARALIVKSMTGSRERTRWWQAGELILDGVATAPALPQGPLVCAGGDLDANVYTYRDMIPVPFESRGLIRCALRFDGEPAPLVVEGSAVRLEMQDVPKYIEHIRP